MQETSGDEHGLHKGVLLATIACALLLTAIVSFMFLQPLLVTSSRTVLRDPANGRTVICEASFAPGFIPGNDPTHAVGACERACENRGFVYVSGAEMDIDYASHDAMLRDQKRWLAIIPASCRP